MANYILVNEIKDGMILAEGIVNNFGQTLLPAGANLTEKHIKLFKTWNITGVMVKSNNGEDDDDAELSPELVMKAKEKLKKRMTWSPRNNLEYDLFEMAVIKLVKMSKVS